MVLGSRARMWAREAVELKAEGMITPWFLLCNVSATCAAVNWLRAIAISSVEIMLLQGR